MKTVLVTGGIGSGKSTVCRYLASKGYPVYDSDSRTKLLYDSVPGLMDRLEQMMGEPLRGKDGKLDKKLLAGIIFNDESKRLQLESVVYPEVLKDFLNWRSEQEADTVVFESAIALEKPLFDSAYDVVVVVTASEEVRVRRNPDAAQRISAQHLDMSRADFVIENDGDLKELYKKTDKIL